MEMPDATCARKQQNRYAKQRTHGVPFHRDCFSRNVWRMTKRPVAAPSHLADRVTARSLALVVALLIGATSEVHAQNSVPNALQGFAQNRDQPVKVEADAFEVRDKAKRATLTGNVKVVQGDTTMTSKSLDVLYRSGSQTRPDAIGAVKDRQPLQQAQPAAADNSAIKRLEARGDVVTQKDKAATGQTAVFDTEANLITMRGGVVLTSCRNVLFGDRLLVDMTTGVSRVEVDHGRVKASINPSPDPGCGATSAPSGSTDLPLRISSRRI